MLVPAHDRAFDLGRLEGDGITLCRKGIVRHGELDLVKPKVTVLAVAFLGAEADGDDLAAVLTG